MANPLPAQFLNFPIVDPKTGMPTIDFQRWLQQVVAMTSNLNLDGSINGGSSGQIDPATLAAQVANLDSNGIVMPGGIDMSRSYINKYLDYISDGTNRKAVTAIDSSGKALIDFSQSGHLYKIIDNIPDGTTRKAVTAIDSSGKALIDFSQSAHVGKHLGNIPDDSTSSRYAVLSVDSNRRALVDFSQSSHLGKHLGNIPDDSTSSRYAVLSVDSNRRALIDLSQGGHLNKILDNIGDGTYVRGSILTSPENIDNANFQASTTALPPPGWVLWYYPTLAYDTSTFYAGTQSLKITSAQFMGVKTSRLFSVRPGDQVKVAAWCKADGAGGVCDLLIAWYSALGTTLTTPEVTSTSTSWTQLVLNQTAPSNAIGYQIFLRQRGAGTYTVWFDAVSASRVRSLDDEIANGTTYNKMSGQPGDAICHQGTSTNATSAYDYRQFSTTSHLIASGESLAYDVWIASGSCAYKHGLDFICSDSTTLRGSGLTDQNGLSVNPQADLTGWANGKWYHRVIDLTPLAGKTITSWYTAFDLATNSTGNIMGRIANVQVGGSWIFSAPGIQGSVLNLGLGSGPGTSNFTNQQTWSQLISIGGTNTQHVANNAITNSASYSATGTQTINNNSEQVVGTVTISTVGGSVAIYGHVMSNAGNAGPFTIRIRKDSLTGTVLITSGIGAGSTSSSPQAVDTSPAASQTYVLTVYENSGGSQVIGNVSLVAMNLKK